MILLDNFKWFFYVNENVINKFEKYQRYKYDKKCYLCFRKYIKDIICYFILKIRYLLFRFYWVYIQRVYVVIKNRFYIFVFIEF